MRSPTTAGSISAGHGPQCPGKRVNPSDLFRLLLAPVSLYLLLYGPGQAMRSTRGTALPPAFGRMALSVAWTSAVGLLLVAAGSYSLPTLLLVNAGTCLFGYVSRGLRQRDPAGGRTRAGAGPLVALLVLCLYWPAWQTQLASWDSSVYMAAGNHLALSGTLEKDDPVATGLNTFTRRRAFSSVWPGAAWKPPFSRLPHSMIHMSHSDSVAHPAHHPLPMLWAAISSEVAGPPRSGAFSGLMLSLAAWALWIFLRRRVPAVTATLGVLGLACSASWYYAGHVALPAPLACFFAWAGIALLDGWEEEGSSNDAGLAGVMLGMAAVARVEFALFVLVSLLARALLRRHGLGCRPLPPRFAVGLGAAFALLATELLLLPAAWTAPLDLAFTWMKIGVVFAALEQPVAAGVVGVALCALCVVGARRLGLARFCATATLTALLAGFAWAGRADAFKHMPGWTVDWLGWPLLLLAPLGLRLAWRERMRHTGNGFFLVFGGLTALLLFYDPHVSTIMPWASRRMVPLLAPMLVVLATLAVSRMVTESTTARGRLAGVAAGVALAVGLLLPAQPMWGRQPWANTWKQLRDFAALLPDDATLLVDSRLDYLGMSAPLWLTWQREVLPVQAHNRRGANRVAGLVRLLEKRGPVYLALPAKRAQDRHIIFTQQEHVADFTFELLLPQTSESAPPEHFRVYPTTVSLLRLEAVYFKARPPAADRPGSD